MPLTSEQNTIIGTSVGVAANNAATIIAGTLAEGFNLDDTKYIVGAYADLVKDFTTVIIAQRGEAAGLLGLVEMTQPSAVPPIVASATSIPPQQTNVIPMPTQAAAPPAEPPAPVYTQTSDGDGDPAMDALWREFFADPSAFYDNRTSKKNPAGPDFAHKTKTDAKGYKQGLWIIDKFGKNPSWVPAALQQAGY